MTGTFKLLRQRILKAFSMTHANTLGPVPCCCVGAGPQDTGAARSAFGPGAGLAPWVLRQQPCASSASQRQQSQELFGEARKKCVLNSSRWHSTLTNLGMNMLGRW